MSLTSSWEKACCDAAPKALSSFTCTNSVNAALMSALSSSLTGLVRAGNDAGKGDWFSNCTSSVQLSLQHFVAQ